MNQQEEEVKFGDLFLKCFVLRGKIDLNQEETLTMPTIVINQLKSNEPKIYIPLTTTTTTITQESNNTETTNTQQST